MSPKPVTIKSIRERADILARAEKLKQEIVALPPAEQARLAADLLEADLPDRALAVLRYVVCNLEKALAK